MIQTTNSQYIETFKKKVSVIDSYVRSIGTDPRMAKEECSEVANPTDPEKQSAD